jgi:hypothetical protein
VSVTLTVHHDVAAATEYEALHKAMTLLRTAYRYIGHYTTQLAPGFWRVSFKVEDMDT